MNNDVLKRIIEYIKTQEVSNELVYYVYAKLLPVTGNVDINLLVEIYDILPNDVIGNRVINLIGTQIYDKKRNLSKKLKVVNKKYTKFFKFFLSKCSDIFLFDLDSYESREDIINNIYYFYIFKKFFDINEVIEYLDNVFETALQDNKISFIRECTDTLLYIYPELYDEFKNYYMLVKLVK